MRFRTFIFGLVTMLVGVLLLSIISGARIVTAQEGSVTWDKPQVIVRTPPKKNRRRPSRGKRPQPPRVTVPLLALQWRVLKLKEGGSEEEVNPTAVFHEGDLLRLAVTANQNGYLYIVHQKEGKDGTVLFPDSRVNDGGNYVRKNQEFALPPADCPLPNPRDCWYKVTSPSTKEFFIIIFSRDLIVNLPNQAALSEGVISQRIINELVASTGDKVKVSSRPPGSRRGSPTGGLYAVWVINPNPKDNEEIIFRVPLIKGE